VTQVAEHTKVLIKQEDHWGLQQCTVIRHMRTCSACCQAGRACQWDLCNNPNRQDSMHAICVDTQGCQHFVVEQHSYSLFACLY
jgi:hypothetical protein